ncbi:hypothetical protein L484_017059 [Morus notabilis]|uniref:Retrotransposon Copia-like N-terminal domain-containing protein n=1 Tax=Morus notabilis TaxID=981085 RepID=W9RKZ4_9ROSA|nr:hypothetical protein L484_017059 [Morus notabilis]
MEKTPATAIGEASGAAAKFVPVTFSHLISTKLDNDNYILWRKQALTVIRRYKLQHFFAIAISFL